MCHRRPRETKAFMNISRITRRLQQELQRLRPRAMRDKMRLIATDAAYDLSNGVITGGARRLRSLTIDSPNRRFGVDYRAVYPKEFFSAMSALPINDYSQYTFIDLGSGKGRAILLAQKYNFRRYIGVEFAKELHELAQANLQDYENIELQCMDATQYVFP